MSLDVCLLDAFA
ncbi:hypothetical protein C1E47_19125 [Vibrio cholerae]|nr:hypothetical protein [Vibrio cholerae]